MVSNASPDGFLFPARQNRSPADVVADDRTGPTLPLGAVAQSVSYRRRIGMSAYAIQVTGDKATEHSHSLNPTQRSEAASVDVPEDLYDAAVLRVRSEAPDAPAGAANEALIRYVGYLLDASPGGDPTDPAGPDPARGSAAAWMRSGAAAVLAPYKSRRAV